MRKSNTNEKVHGEHKRAENAIRFGKLLLLIIQTSREKKEIDTVQLNKILKSRFNIESKSSGYGFYILDLLPKPFT